MSVWMCTKSLSPYVSEEQGAEVVFLGTIGTRQCDIGTLVRKLQVKAPHLLFVYEAGPCGYRLCDLTGNPRLLGGPHRSSRRNQATA